MYKYKKIISVIPARKNSKQIPGKNWKPLNGKPLISYSIEQSLDSKYIDYTIVSSDSQDIKEIVHNFQLTNKNLIFVDRPEELAGDNSPTEDAMIHAIESVKDIIIPEIVCLLQPTSPSRSKDLIDRCIEKYFQEGANALMTVTQFPPFFVTGDGLEWFYDPKNRPMRQSIRKEEWFMFDNGNLYLTNVNVLLKTKCRIGDKLEVFITSEAEGYQIDTPLDFKIMETIMKEMTK